jgi:hypothetical protein
MKLGKPPAFTLLCDPLRVTGSPRHCADTDGMPVSSHDSERHYLRMVTEEEELAALEEHLLGCHVCLDLVLETERYVGTIRASVEYQRKVARSACER